MPNPVQSVDELEPGDRVTVICKTSDANIFLKAHTVDYRSRFVPEPCLLTPARYMVEGIVVGINSEGPYPYLVMSIWGECAVIDWQRECPKVVGTERRAKICHVPIQAIIKLTVV